MVPGHLNKEYQHLAAPPMAQFMLHCYIWTSVRWWHPCMKFVQVQKRRKNIATELLTNFSDARIFGPTQLFKLSQGTAAFSMEPMYGCDQNFKWLSGISAARNWWWHCECCWSEVLEWSPTTHQTGLTTFLLISSLSSRGVCEYGIVDFELNMESNQEK